MHRTHHAAVFAMRRLQHAIGRYRMRTPSRQDYRGITAVRGVSTLCTSSQVADPSGRARCRHTMSTHAVAMGLLVAGIGAGAGVGAGRRAFCAGRSSSAGSGGDDDDDDASSFSHRALAAAAAAKAAAASAASNAAARAAKSAAGAAADVAGRSSKAASKVEAALRSGSRASEEELGMAQSEAAVAVARSLMSMLEKGQEQSLLGVESYVACCLRRH